VLHIGDATIFPVDADQLAKIRGVIDAWLEANTQAPAAVC
jgi:hypothetical protein